MVKTAVLVSGGGTNLQAILDAKAAGKLPHAEISLVVASRPDAALAKGVKVTGATVHFVNEIPDGGEIIAQKAVEVLPGDTPEVLQKRVMEQAEWILLPQAVEDVARSLCQQ